MEYNHPIFVFHSDKRPIWVTGWIGVVQGRTTNFLSDPSLGFDLERNPLIGAGIWNILQKLLFPQGTSLRGQVFFPKKYFSRFLFSETEIRTHRFPGDDQHIVGKIRIAADRAGRAH